MNNNRMIVACCVGPLVCAGVACGQATFNGAYSQNFDGLAQTGSVVLTGQGPHALEGVLGSTGMVGWYGANLAGTSGNTEVRAQDGSLSGSAGRGVVFFGTTGSADRALGALPTSNQVSSFGIVLLNTSSETYTGLDISFFGEQWRAGEASIPNMLSFSYGIGSSLVDATNSFSTLNFTAPILTGGEFALNGNLAANRTLISDMLSGLNWAPGQSLVLRWDIADLTGQDNGLAIDDLNIIGLVPTPGVLALLGLAGLTARSRRRR